MTKEKDIKTVVPALRFPEFRDAEGWQATQLSKLGETVSGLTYTPSDIRESGLLVLRSSNIKDGRIALDDCVYVKDNVKGANLSQPNDILICVRNGSASLIGKNALIPYNMPLCTHGAFMTVFRAHNPDFIFQLFQTEAYQNQVNADLGARINSINNSQLNKYKFAVPKPAEQEKVADCLGSLDDLISAVVDKIEALKLHKKGLMQQLFPAEGKTTPALRFPEFQNAGEWKEKPMEEIFTIRNGYTPSKSKPDYWTDGTIPWFRMEDIRENGTILSDSIQHITPEAVKCNGLFPANSIIVATTATIGVHALIIVDSLANQRFTFLTKHKSLIDKLDMVYFYHYMFIVDEWCKKNINMGGFASVNMTGFKKLLIPIPKPAEQQRIADCLSSVDELISAQTDKLNQLKAHKKGLMQQLFPTINE